MSCATDHMLPAACCRGSPTYTLLYLPLTCGLSSLVKEDGDLCIESEKLCHRGRLIQKRNIGAHHGIA